MQAMTLKVSSSDDFLGYQMQTGHTPVRSAQVNEPGRNKRMRATTRLRSDCRTTFIRLTWTHGSRTVARQSSLSRVAAVTTALAVEKTQGVDVDDEDDGVGRERTEVGDGDAAEEHRRSLGPPALHDTVQYAEVAAARRSSGLRQ